MARPKVGTGNHPAVGAGVDGEVVAAPTGASRTAGHLPKLQPNADFVLAAHPSRLMVIDGRVVHSLIRLEVSPGIDNVEKRARKASIGRMKASREERGWTFVPGEAAPNGVNYVKRVRVRNGVHHMTIFEQAYAGSDVIGTNSKAYADWLVALREEGILPPLARFAVVKLRQARQRKLQAAADKASTIPSKALEAKQVQAEIDAIDKALAELAEPQSRHLTPIKDEEVVAPAADDTTPPDETPATADDTATDEPPAEPEDKPKASRKSKAPTAKS